MITGRPRVSYAGPNSNECCDKPAYLQCAIAETTCLNPDIILLVIIQKDDLETAE